MEAPSAEPSGQLEQLGAAERHSGIKPDRGVIPQALHAEHARDDPHGQEWSVRLDFRVPSLHLRLCNWQLHFGHRLAHS
jgi:hypothetical protein